MPLSWTIIGLWWCSRGATVDLVFIGPPAHHSLRLTGCEVQQSRQDRLDVRLITSALDPMSAS